MATMWKRLFKKHDAVTEAVESAIEKQAAFEKDHPVAFDAATRQTALLERAAIHYGAKLPAKAVELLALAVDDWGKATKAAEEAT
jgi:hypothetical protein